MGNAESKRVPWQVLHRTMSCVHSNENPTHEDWEGHLRGVKANPDLQRIIVLTRGGAPNATQRAALNDVLRNVRARGAGTALRWFNPLMRIFDPDDVERALDHVGAPKAIRLELTLALKALEQEVSAKP